MQLTPTPSSNSEDTEKGTLLLPANETFWKNFFIKYKIKEHYSISRTKNIIIITPKDKALAKMKINIKYQGTVALGSTIVKGKSGKLLYPEKYTGEATHEWSNHLNFNEAPLYFAAVLKRAKSFKSR